MLLVRINDPNDPDAAKYGQTRAHPGLGVLMASAGMVAAI
jgi:hypothetical protein